MNILIIMLVIIIILILITLNIKIEIKINYITELNIYINVSLLGISIFKKYITPENSSKKENKNDFKSLLNKINKNKDIIKEILNNRKEIKKILKIIKNNTKYKLYTKIKFGLDSPVDTAKISGILLTIAALFNNDNCKIQVEPVFNEDTIEFKFETTLKIRILICFIKIINIIRKEPLKHIFKKIHNRRKKNNEN